MAFKLMPEHLQQIAAICRNGGGDNHPEQGGWITQSQGVFEVQNVSENPCNQFAFGRTPYDHDSIFQWHSHPGDMRFAHFSDGDFESADLSGKATIMHHPQSGEFSIYIPENASHEIDLSGVEGFAQIYRGSRESVSQQSSALVTASPLAQSNQSHPQIAAQSQQNALALLAKLQVENQRLQSEIQVEEAQIAVNSQRSQFLKSLASVEAGTQESLLQLAEVNRREAQLELEQKLKLNQLKYGGLWKPIASP